MGLEGFRPHSITEREHWQSVGTSDTTRGFLEEAAHVAADLPPRPDIPAASDFLAARRRNDRSPLDHHWRTHRRQLSALIVQRCHLGPQEQDDRLLDWLWDMLTEATWAVSAHLPGQDLPRTGESTLDLAACDMAALMAEAREVLRPWLDGASGTLADTIVAEIDRRVLDPFVAGPETWWITDAGRINNWIGVCAGSILAACESLAAQGIPRPQAREKALHCLRRFYAEAFTAAGECDEGVSYWSYGAGMACLGLMRLSASELSQVMDLERMKQVADYPRRCHLFDDCFFSGNDAGLRARAPLYFVPWLARTLDLPWLGQWAAAWPSRENWHLGQWLRVLDEGRGGGDGRVGSANTADGGTFLPDQQVLIARHETPRGPLVICLSGGHNAERHNHNDLGHFIVTLDKTILVPDLGAPHYRADFFGPHRYERYLTASSRGHCCPIIGGQAQREGREAAGRVVQVEPDARRIVLDLSAAYPPAAGLKRWVRSLAGTLITDEFQTSEPGVEVCQVLWLLTRPQVDQASACVEVSAGPLLVRASPRPMRVLVEEHDPAAHLMRDFAGQKLYRVEAQYHTDGQGALQTTMDFQVV
jgi:hypothetical protein